MSRQNTIEKILSMSYNEFVGMDERQMRKAVSRLSSAANKRINRLIKADITSPALIEAKEGGGKFGVAGKSADAVRAEFFRVKSFLKSESSTVSGAKNLESTALQAIKNVYGVDLNRGEYRKLLNGYYEGFNKDPAYQAQRLRYGSLYKLFGIAPGNNEASSIMQLSQRMVNLLDRYLMPGGMGYDGFAEFFDLE